MTDIDIVKKNKNIDDFVELAIGGLPDGVLYNESLSDFIKGFLTTYQDFLLQFNQAMKDQFFITENSLFLDEQKIMFGLPNVIFPDLSTKAQTAFAISMMKYSKNLISKEDYENFMLILGIKVKLYSLNNTLLENSCFDYGFPGCFSSSVTKKDKLTYWIYVEENNTAMEDFYGLGDAFDLDFVSPRNNLETARKILDFLKPDYLIFEYITLETKNLFGL